MYDKGYKEEITRYIKFKSQNKDNKERLGNEKGKPLPSSDTSELIRKVEGHNSKDIVDTKFGQVQELSEVDRKIQELLGRSDNLWLCKLCMKTGSHKAAIKVHIESHLEDNFVNNCEVCGKKFPTRVGLKSHMNFVHDEENIAKVVTCEKCGKSGMSKSQLQGHNARIHSTFNQGIVYKCDICSQVLKDAANLRGHIKNVHNPDKVIEIFTCDICGKGGMTARMYAGHKRRNHVDKHKIDLETKVAVIKAREEPNATTKEVATSFNLGLSTVQLILKNKEQHVNKYFAK